MKGLLITLLVIGFLIALGSCEDDKPNPVVTLPDVVVIPDNNFLSALIDLGIDANLDGTISPREAESIKSLDVSEDSISDMTGIEAFVNLEHLDCGENQLSSLDVSNNTALTILQLWNNQLTNLDVSSNIALTELLLRRNQLTNLDVSNSTALTTLVCDANQLTSLDVSKNTALTRLFLGGNQLTSLDVSSNIALIDLSLADNQLTSFDVSNNTALIYLGLAHQQLTSLDVSNNIALERLDLSHNQLTSLDVSNNTALTSINFHDMPSINEVCVWETPFPPEGVHVDTTNSPKVYFTTDCTGGD